MSLRWGVVGALVLAGLMAETAFDFAQASINRGVSEAPHSEISPTSEPELPHEWLVVQSGEADEALRLYQEGRELFEQETEESLRSAIEKFDAVIPLLQEDGEIFGEAVTRYWFGFAQFKLGNNREALNEYEKSLAIFEAATRQTEDENLQEFQLWQARTLNNIGMVYNALSENQQALEFYNLALPLYRVAGNRAGEGATLNNIGVVYYIFGQNQKALGFYNQALPIRRVAGDQGGEAGTLNNIGLVYSSLGEYQKQKALDHYNQALPLLRTLEDHSGEATTLNNIGLAYDDLGERQQALDTYNQALSLSRSVGNRFGEAKTLGNIGSVYHALGEWRQAINFYKQALSLSQDVGNRSGEATTLSNIGLIYRNRPRKTG